MLPESDKLSASNATISAPMPRLVPPPRTDVVEDGDPTFMQIYLAVVLGDASNRLVSQLLYADFISQMRARTSELFQSLEDFSTKRSSALPPKLSPGPLSQTLALTESGTISLVLPFPFLWYSCPTPD